VASYAEAWKSVCTELATLMQFRCGSTNYKVAN